MGSLATVTSKGQVTIPAEIRHALDLEAGDSLLFATPKNNSVRFRVLRRRRLTELAGALSVNRSWPGKAVVREEVGRSRGRELAGRTDS